MWLWGFPTEVSQFCSLYSQSSHQTSLPITSLYNFQDFDQLTCYQSLISFYLLFLLPRPNSLNSYLKSFHRSSKAHFEECLTILQCILCTKECTLSVYQHKRQRVHSKTIRNTFFVLMHSQMEFHVSSVFLCMSPCKCFHFGSGSSDAFLLLCGQMSFNLYQKHSIVWRGLRFNQHLQNRFLLKNSSLKLCCCRGRLRLQKKSFMFSRSLMSY